jgi:hypothetical protein
MTRDELHEIEIIVEGAVARGLQNCPMGADHEGRMRQLEGWKNGHQALVTERQLTKTALWLPLIVVVVGQLITTIFMWHIGK